MANCLQLNQSSHKLDCKSDTWAGSRWFPEPSAENWPVLFFPTPLALLLPILAALSKCNITANPVRHLRRWLSDDAWHLFSCSLGAVGVVAEHVHGLLRRRLNMEHCLSQLWKPSSSASSAPASSQLSLPAMLLMLFRLSPGCSTCCSDCHQAAHTAPVTAHDTTHGSAHDTTYAVQTVTRLIMLVLRLLPVLVTLVFLRILPKAEYCYTFHFLWVGPSVCLYIAAQYYILYDPYRYPNLNDKDITRVNKKTGYTSSFVKLNLNMGLFSCIFLIWGTFLLLFFFYILVLVTFAL